MKPLEPCWRAVFSPSANFEAVPATTVQQTMRQWFERWGRPQQIQLDHGHPWAAGNQDLPSLFQLWLIGLGIEVVFSRVHHPQDNGKVERAHRTLQAWSAPTHCHDLAHLQHSLDCAIVLQRQFYPNRHGQSRWQRFPALSHCERPYQQNHEAQHWSLSCVCAFLQTQQWQRKVDRSGRISLYNHNYHVSRAYAKQQVWVRFDATTREWVFLNQAGDEVNRAPALEIDATTIRQLQPHRSTAKQQHSPPTLPP
jgi:hypothetical protein